MIELALLSLTIILVREHFFRLERQEAAQERQALLQRIQAPELAVVSHATEEPHEPVNGMPLFSDEDYEAMTTGQPSSSQVVREIVG